MSDQRTWIYGVVPAGVDLVELDKRRDRLGVDVSLIELDDLAAIVSDAPADDAKATRDRALQHARVLEAAVVDAPVVPLRFGIIVPGGDAEVGDELLKARHDELAQLLDRVRDHVQLTVKAEYHEDAILREIVDGNPEIRELRDQAKQGDEMATRDVRVRMGELIGATLDSLRERDAGQILHDLQQCAVATATEPLESEFMVVHAPCLVVRDRREEFEQAVESMADQNSERMHFVLLGPMPGYSFIGSEEPAWA